MSTRLTTRATTRTTRRRARRRKRRERYHHARIVSSSRVARARRRDDTSSTIPRDDSARVRDVESHPRRHRADARASRRDASPVARNTPHVTSALARESPTASRRTSTDGRGPPTISVTAVPRVLARGPRRTTARGGSRPIGDRTANEQKARALASPRARSPRPGTLARASSRTVEPSIRARAMDAPPSGLDGESRPVVCPCDARARKRGDDSVYSVVSKTMKRRAGDGRGRDDGARAGVNRRVMNRRVSDSTTGPPRVLDTHRAVGRSFLRHPSGIAVLHIYTGSK